VNVIRKEIELFKHPDITVKNRHVTPFIFKINTYRYFVPHAHAYYFQTQSYNKPPAAAAGLDDLGSQDHFYHLA
jgi:hypothetical protein